MSLLATLIMGGLSAGLSAAGIGTSASRSKKAQEAQNEMTAAQQKAQDEENRRQAAAQGRLQNRRPDQNYASVYANGGPLVFTIPLDGVDLDTYGGYALGGLMRPRRGPRDGSSPGPRKPLPNCPYNQKACGGSIKKANGGEITSIKSDQGQALFGAGDNGEFLLINPMALGGLLGQIGMSPDGAPITIYESGGTHEQNPRGGVPLSNGNSVEEGEVRFGDYVFSNRF